MSDQKFEKLGDFFTATAVEARKDRNSGYVVHVEDENGQWNEIDATGPVNAQTIAQKWVDEYGARGCSCRMVLPTGKLVARPFFTHYWALRGED